MNGDKMSSRKSKELKEFMISQRKKIGTGYTSAPVWAMQKKKERIWNSKQKRHWKQVDLGKAFRRRSEQK